MSKITEKIANSLNFTTKTSGSNKTENKYKNYNQEFLIEEYLAQLNYGGPNVAELKQELQNRGLPTDENVLDKLLLPPKYGVSEIPSDIIRAQYMPQKTDSKYKNYKTKVLLEEYLAQLNYDGPDVKEIKKEFQRRGLPTMAEHPELFSDRILKSSDV